MFGKKKCVPRYDFPFCLAGLIYLIRNIGRNVIRVTKLRIMDCGRRETYSEISCTSMKKTFGRPRQRWENDMDHTETV